MDACHLDTFGPVPVHRPATVEQLCGLVREAGGAIYPLGGGTMQDLGTTPTRPGIAVSLGHLKQIIDYPARDMTITAQAGLTVAELQRILAAEGQRLPVDVPLREQATIGGALAVNASGSRRLGAGTFRDYVIGITTINDQGQETKAGGRVVKNVAGYDLCKLHIGALGTLGIISQVTLKVRPRPETQALLAFGCDSALVPLVLDTLHQGRTRPMCVDLLNGPATRRLKLPDHPWTVVVGYEDSEPAVTWQVGHVMAELTAIGVQGVEALAGAVTEALWDGLAELTHPPEVKVSFKITVLPSQVTEVCSLLPPEAMIQAHAASGVVRVHWSDDLTQAGAAAMLKKLTEAVVSRGGNVIVPRCPAEWKRELPVWGAARNDVWLMRQVKQQLDPRGMFNPGRFLEGL